MRNKLVVARSCGKEGLGDDYLMGMEFLLVVFEENVLELYSCDDFTAS